MTNLKTYVPPSQVLWPVNLAGCSLVGGRSVHKRLSRHQVQVSSHFHSRPFFGRAAKSFF